MSKYAFSPIFACKGKCTRFNSIKKLNINLFSRITMAQWKEDTVSKGLLSSSSNLLKKAKITANVFTCI